MSPDFFVTYLSGRSVCALLAQPERLAEEDQRHVYPDRHPPRMPLTTLEAQLGKLRQGLAQLIDSYADALIEKPEFEPRITRLRQRIAHVEAQHQQLAEEDALHTDVRLISGRLEDFAAQVQEGLAEADWNRKRDMIRALVKRVEVAHDQVEVVFRIDPRPGDPSPEKKVCKIVGGVSSPMLANLFLDHVLDEWFERDVRPRMKGRCVLIRFADDFVIGCEREDDARRILAVLPKRFARFKLTIHPQKTRLVRFQPPRGLDEGGRGDGTFDFLGLTHYWAKSRRGYWVIKRRTAKKRLWRAMRAVWHWCRAHRHDPIRAQYRALCQKLRGHDQYYGIRGNYRKLEALYRSVERAWRYWLSRRGGPRTIRWETFAKLCAVLPLPTPRIMHNI